MAGRRHVISAPRHSGEVDREPGSFFGSHQRSPSDATSSSRHTSSSTSGTPTPTLGPSSSGVRHFLSKDKDSSIASSSFDLKKLPFFGDRDKDMAGSHSRATSPVPLSSASASLAAVAAAANISAPGSSSVSPAPVPSPSKSTAGAPSINSGGRTYDAKLMAREMLRLGALGQSHLSSNLAPTIGGSAAALSTSPVPHLTALPSLAGTAPSLVPTPSSSATLLGHSHIHGGSSLASVSSANDGGAWAQLHVLVLPLFNHEPLQAPIEDLNMLVRRHIESVLSRGFGRALATLENDATELVHAGMITLGTKLSGVAPDDDAKLLVRVIEIWGFFWDQVLPYVEGVFLPLQTDGILLSLFRTPRRPSSSPALALSALPDESAASNSQQNAGSTATSSIGSPPIDVRTIILRAFRDSIIVPVASRLEARLMAAVLRDGSIPTSDVEIGNYQLQRLQQMLLVLHSQAQRPRPTLSLTAPRPSLSPQESAIRKLLDSLTLHRAAMSGTLPVGGANSIHPHASSHSSYSRDKASAHALHQSTTPLVPASAILGLNLNGSGPSRRPPSFLSAGAPRDRRGRIASRQKPRPTHVSQTNVRPRPQKAVVRGDSAEKRRGRFIDGDISTDGGEEDNGGEDGDELDEDGFGDEGEDGYGNGEWYGDEGGSEGGGEHGGATPRGRFSTSAYVHAERERSRTLLESLRSPGPNEPDGEDHDRNAFGFGQEEEEVVEHDSGPAEDSDSSEDYDDHGTAKRIARGWGLGPGEAESEEWAVAEDDLEENISEDWDETQAEVVRSMGMSTSPLGNGSTGLGVALGSGESRSHSPSLSQIQTNAPLRRRFT